MHKPLLLFLSFSFCFVLISCVVDIAPNPTLNYLPVADQYPLHIGFYHSNRYMEHQVNALDGTGYKFLLAETSTKLAQLILQSMFRKVEPVLDKYTPPEHLDGIISVDIDGFQSPFENNALKVNQAIISYRFALFDSKNNPIGILKITGKGTSNKVYLLYPTLQDAIELAMKDAMAQFMVGFGKQPEFKRWLKAQGINNDAPD